MIVLEWLFLTITIAPCDAAEPWQLGSQDAATPMMQGIIDLHHDIFFFLILILVFVSWILVRTLWHFHYKKNPIPQRIVHGTTIEILWTIFPSIILMFIAIPSFALLYSMDEVVVDPAITIKAIGHQWYRTYEYSDYNSSDEQSLTFDSYMIPEDDPELGQSRLLEVDNRVVVPAKTHLRIIVTSADVLHSWAVPSLGVKCDAVPGRLNQTSISVQREGVYYGQCSEICGTNHAFMPIVVEAVDRKDYGSRVSNHGQETRILSPKENKILVDDIRKSIAKFDRWVKTTKEPSPEEIVIKTIEGRESFRYSTWNSLVMELKHYGAEVLPNNNNNTFQAWSGALQKILPKESAEVSQMRAISRNLNKEGVENTTFKQLLEFVKLKNKRKYGGN
uniref:Cytochrome c oxidase subunit 2 n=1 Tax=Psychotria viridis TaxID=189196 RepID=A0A977PM55_9GENT|nr:cytochrome c oxidase subunit 2 [Psychotria viridis]YP_010502964.1 cytochrome c oxidase subunit 2 [Psychotria viridis]UXD78733.1 cytochrome c oxidase subunit 2 [Psychotria viridis]UXD78741.1 cytochrome c oxidase subunit 2 [Psychotria viridis]UXD78776.1 cytochrome c oxidase subunit 2 [Psychotria viridis]UXD78784.1 cytochrome c oxidase subunit 2 [Psychotria viridis]